MKCRWSTGTVLALSAILLAPACTFGTDKPYVVLERAGVRAVIVNNQAVDDQVLPGHREGYSGVAALARRGQDRNLFVPMYPQFPLTLVFNLSDYRYREPWYYGVSHGMALAQMFRPRDQVRLSQSPSGGGEGNPAWDFQWFVPRYEVGQRYRFVMRALYLPFESAEQVTRATAAHRAVLRK